MDPFLRFKSDINTTQFLIRLLSQAHFLNKIKKKEKSLYPKESMYKYKLFNKLVANWLQPTQSLLGAQLTSKEEFEQCLKFIGPTKPHLGKDY